MSCAHGGTEVAHRNSCTNHLIPQVRAVRNLGNVRENPACNMSKREETHGDAQPKQHPHPSTALSSSELTTTTGNLLRHALRDIHVGAEGVREDRHILRLVGDAVDKGVLLLVLQRCSFAIGRLTYGAGRGRGGRSGEVTSKIVR